MKRLCIYVTYNREHEIKEYMGYMAKCMKPYCSKLYVVCNYPKIEADEKYIEPYADKIFCRENRGYDAGGYKDMICTLLGWDIIYQYDELILMNDSFLGPFYDMGRYFDQMEDVTCDFWGMTREFPGYLKSMDYNYSSHVHSYFLVFRKRCFNSVHFREFWEKFVYPQSFAETVLYFEIKINEYMQEKGYISMALTDIWGMKFKRNENPYYLYSWELISDNGLPVLKKKCLLIRNAGFANTLKAIEFIVANRLYPAKWIWELIDGQFHIDGYASKNGNCLEFFVKKYKKVYIYGAGLCGKNLTIYFEKKGWQYEAILVTDKKGQQMACKCLEDVDIDEETGIIISVIHPEVSEEIIRNIGTRCKKEQLFAICDCPAIQLPK